MCAYSNAQNRLEEMDLPMNDAMLWATLLCENVGGMLTNRYPSVDSGIVS